MTSLARAWPSAWLVTGAMVLAALSLVRPWALAFDPMAWLVWGRETGRLALDTTSGPSWKPFPVVITTLIAPFGGAAPALWLIVARAGGLMALAGASVLATRLAGRWAGAAALAVMALSPWWAFNTALGNSEGLLAAAVLWAVVAHLAARPRAALALATAASLMRPEAWPFLAVYDLWLWRARPEHRGAVVLAAAVIPLLWFGPDVLGAGGALDASLSARGIPTPGSAKLAPSPALAVLGNAVAIATLPTVAAASIAAVLAGPLARGIAAAAAAWIALVAVMTVAGYAGNPRYLVAAAALGATLAGAGAVRAATAVAATGVGRGRAALAPPVGAALLVAAVLATTAGTLREQSRELSARAAAAAAFDGVIEAAGGRDALMRCSPIRTSARARSLVAWRLDLPRETQSRPKSPAVVIRAKWFYGQGLEPPAAPGYRALVTTPYWQIVTACGRTPWRDAPDRAALRASQYRDRR